MLCLPACLSLLLAADTLPAQRPVPPAPVLSAAAQSAGPRRVAMALVFTPSPTMDGDPARDTRVDTLRRPAMVELSDGYYTRLRIHRTGSWLMLPIFAAQYAAGDQLMRRGSDAPEWARRAHGPLAVGVATLFTVNTVTGGWNAWEARGIRQGRGRRLLHSALMLAADAGFTATGMMAEDAEESASRRQQHRTVALASMGVAAAGWIVMLPIFGERE